MFQYFFKIIYNILINTHFIYIYILRPKKERPYFIHCTDVRMADFSHLSSITHYSMACIQLLTKQHVNFFMYIVEHVSIYERYVFNKKIIK